MRLIDAEALLDDIKAANENGGMGNVIYKFGSGSGSDDGYGDGSG